MEDGEADGVVELAFPADAGGAVGGECGFERGVERFGVWS